MQLLKCFFISFFVHFGQKDKAGKMYFGHLFRVMLNVEGYVEKCVALLHDVIEDTKLTDSSLLKLGVKPIIVENVKLLTKIKGSSYEEYLLKIKQSEIARKVKLADLKDNMNLNRLKIVTREDVERIAKYEKAKKLLTIY